MTGVVPEPLAAALADRYELLRELGAGGMATVYLARDVRHAREVAIKVLHPELAAVLGAERFLSEIRTTASLQHPHILPLFDSGEAAGQLFYVMPFVDGETLRTRLEREKQLPIGDALLIAREVADALQYAHERGVIHRDIKPENILLQGGHALVADFGIALAVTNAGGTRMTQTGLSLGTPQYMAPEQAMGERTIDARADVYALGAVTYEMLAGEPPFTGPTSQAIVARVLTERPRPLPSQRETVPPQVDAAVMTAMAKLAADRFASARAFADALSAPGSTHQTSGSVVSPPVPQRSKRPWLPWAAAASAAALAVAGWMRRTDPLTAVAAAPVVATLTPDDSVDWAVESGQGFALSPDGRRLAVLTRGSGSTRQLLIRSLDQEELRTVATGDLLFPFWSPRGDSLGYFDGGVLRLLDIERGKTRAACTNAPVAGQRNGAAWGANGDILFALSPAIHWVRPRGDAVCRAVPLRVPRDRPAGRPYFLDDGEHFVLTEARNTWIGSLAESTMTRLLLHPTGNRSVVAPGNFLFYDDGSSVVARRIDVAAQTLTGAPLIVTDRARSDNSYLAISASANGLLVVARTRDEGEQWLYRWHRRTGALDSLPAETNGAWAPTLSHDGRRLALTGAGVRVIDVQTGTSIGSKLDFDSVRIVKTPGVWHPADTLLVFSYRAPSGEPTLVSFDPATERSARFGRPLSGSRSLTLHDWSPDGRWMLLQRGAGEGVRKDELVLMDAVNREMHTYFDSDVSARDPRISPNGRWAAYQAGDGNDVYMALRSFPDGTRVLRVAAQAGRRPRWRADSKELYFESPQDGLVAVTISESGVAGSPRVVLSNDVLGALTTGAEVSPDGETIFAVGQRARRRLGLTLMINWQSLVSGVGRR